MRRIHMVAGTAALFLGPVLAGCLPEVSVPPLQTSQNTPKNLIERTLTTCIEKTLDAEARCVKGRFSDGSVPLARLIAIIPGCRPGRVCSYEYTTEDRVGYLAAYATHIVYGWRVNFDLTQRPKSTAEVPITLEVR